jgi:hypothetical protein
MVLVLISTQLSYFEGERLLHALKVEASQRQIRVSLLEFS